MELPYLYTSNLELFRNLFTNALRTIRSTDNPRTIVLETWLIIDFIIRELLATGLELNRYMGKKFDPKIEILPLSFEACIRAIEKIYIDQSSKKIRPKNGPGLTGDMKFFQIAEKKGLLKKMKEVMDDYYSTNFPEAASGPIKSNILTYRPEEFRVVSEGWLEAAKRLLIKSGKKLQEKSIGQEIKPVIPMTERICSEHSE